jgi:hypothetical protein
LNLLRSQFREIRIPIAVQFELDQVSHAAALKEIQQAFQDGWIGGDGKAGDRVDRCDW